MILMSHGLQAFRAVAEAGTVHSAADKLGLTQTAITQRLKSLEAHLGLTFFLRSRPALIKLFSQGVGYGTLTESVAEPHLKGEKLITLNRGQAMEDPLALIWYPRPQRPTYFEDLIRAIR